MRELSLHILDLVQNAIEAGSSKIQLEIEEDTVLDTLCIKVADNGRGMSVDEVSKVTNPFTTTRTTRKVGLGLSLIDMSTQHCGGSLTIDSAVGKGTTVTACYRYSHIDRPPLGPMQPTLVTILVANPDIDFSYRHRFNQQSFEFHSQDIKEILGDIPLTQPEVLIWLNQFLSNHYDRLQGGIDYEDN